MCYWLYMLLLKERRKNETKSVTILSKSIEHWMLILYTILHDDKLGIGKWRIGCSKATKNYLAHNMNCCFFKFSFKLFSFVRKKISR